MSLAHLWKLFKSRVLFGILAIAIRNSPCASGSLAGSGSHTHPPAETIRILLERIRRGGRDSCHKYGHLSLSLSHSHVLSLHPPPFSLSSSLHTIHPIFFSHFVSSSLFHSFSPFLWSSFSLFHISALSSFLPLFCSWPPMDFAHPLYIFTYFHTLWALCISL